MVLKKELINELINLRNDIENVVEDKSITNMKLESFLKNFEKRRYNILNEIKIYNENVEFEYEKIKSIDNQYLAKFEDDILKIYIPETIPSFKNIKTHTHKRILLNIAEITKKFAGVFDDEVFMYIKVFDNIKGWDIDNKCIKPISDGLILSKVIKDDNINNMFYCAKGEYSEIPHTEIYILDSKNVTKFLKEITYSNREKR